MNPKSLLLFTASFLLASGLPAQPASTRATHAADGGAGTRQRKAEAVAVDWHDVTTWGVEGREFGEEKRLRWFDRLPAAAEATVTKKVWDLSRDSTGMVVHFKTDASSLHVHYLLARDRLSMPHMPATSASGVDFYARNDKGEWKWVAVTKPTAKEVKVEVVNGLMPGLREYAAYLPLYNGVEYLRIGVPAGARFEGVAPRRKPIVFYGTSITHGASSSRAGMVHPAILGRRLDRPVVNLGFAGNGHMDAAVGDCLVRIDAAAYVIDCLPNMSPKLVTERTEPLVRQIRAVKAATPIVLVEDRRLTNEWIRPERKKFHDENHAALKAAYERLVKAGVKNLFYIPGDHLYGDDGEGATDGSHASDLGFVRQADVMEPILIKALAAK